MATCAAVGALPLVATAGLLARARRDREFLTLRAAVLLAGAGVAAGAGSWALTGLGLRAAEISLEVTRGDGLTSLLALALFVAPLEEALKVAVVWPLVVLRRVDGAGVGVIVAVTAAAGFAAADGALHVAAAGATGLGVTRALAGLPAHAFAAGLWGYALGERGHGGRFAPAWLLAVAIHAVYDHVVFGRGPGMLGVGVPMLLAMGLLTWSALRDIAPSTVDMAALPLPVHLPEPPRLGDIRRALRRTDRPVALGWVLTGAFVNVGTIVAALVAAVVAARSLGIDLAAADEADMRANGPLVLLGSAVLGAFPVAGFVVARASGTRSLVEPALAAAIALVMTAALLSATAPIAVLVVLALAPVAFGLACLGGWFGLEA